MGVGRPLKSLMKTPDESIPSDGRSLTGNHRATVPFDHVFTAFIGRADETTGLDAATGPKIGKSARPMIAAWLNRSRRGAGVACPRAGLIVDLGRPSKLAGHDHQHSFVQSSFVNVLDQCGNRLIVRCCTKSHRVKDMMIDCVVVPVADAATQRPRKLLVNTSTPASTNRRASSNCCPQLLRP